MLGRKNLIYFCQNPKAWRLSIKITEKLEKHNIGTCFRQTIIWPQENIKEGITPAALAKISVKMKKKNWLFIDRLKNVETWVTIKNHVNRAGINFLVGETPFKKKVRFPDLSEIYNLVEGYPAVTVHTLGEERFKERLMENNTVWSELIGIVAPLAHYVGIQVSAMGADLESLKEKREKIESLFNGLC